MKKPYVTVHIASSVDGRIKPNHWPSSNLSKIFEETAEKIKVDAWVVGRITMEGFSSKKSHKLGKPDAKIKKIDFIGKHSTKTYAVVIDPSGKCRWDSNMVTTEHVIEILTEKVSTAYLNHLQEKQVSYIFAGKTEINLAMALRKLNKLFGIKKVRVDGGGSVNGSFLKAGLVDELSHLIIPLADGSMQTPTVFDVEVGHTRRKVKMLKLLSLRKLRGDVLWLRYKVKN